MFFVSESKIDIKPLIEKIQNPRAGAMVTFEGWVRNHNEGKAVERLEYEAYIEMCNKEAEKILSEAKEKFDILNFACVHRVGKLEIGDRAVWVGVTTEHRKEAFLACEYIIDEIKARLPIWKKEHYVEGESEWVNCQRCSDHEHKH